MSVTAIEPHISGRAGKRSGGTDEDRLQAIAGGLLIAISTVIPALAGNSYLTQVFLTANLFIAVAVFQNFLYADAGQTSFGQGAIFGIAAYTTAVATELHQIPYGISILLGVAAATAGGFLFALPALRVQGFYLGFITLALAMVFPGLLVSADAWTHGVAGIRVHLSGLSAPVLFGISGTSILIVTFGLAALTLHVWIRRTVLGRRIRMAAASPEAARSLGVDPGRMRLIAFAIASAGTGVAGILYVPLIGFISPDAFHLDLSIIFFFAVIIGGRGQLLGPVVGVWVFYLLPNVLLAEYVQYRLLIYGVMAMLVMMLFPEGVAGHIGRWLHRGKARSVHDLEDDLQLDGLLPGQAERALLPGSAVPAGPAIEILDARKSFGQVAALNGVSLSIGRGEILGLVGANGSGKTTLLNILSGFTSLDSGRLTINGLPTAGMAAHRIARLGIGRTFQTPRVFREMTLWENVQLGLDSVRRGSRDELASGWVEAARIRLSGRGARWIPHGSRRLLEMARVIVTRSEILLLDEPAAGLSPDERKHLAVLLRKLRDQLGKTVILVEHDLDLVWNIADRIAVMDAGRLVSVGSPEQVARDPEAQHMFLSPGRKDEVG